MMRWGMGVGKKIKEGKKGSNPIFEIKKADK